MNINKKINDLILEELAKIYTNYRIDISLAQSSINIENAEYYWSTDEYYIIKIDISESKTDNKFKIHHNRNAIKTKDLMKLDRINNEVMKQLRRWGFKYILNKGYWIAETKDLINFFSDTYTEIAVELF